MFRLQLNDDGVTAFPTYDQLRPIWPRCRVRRKPRTRPWRALTLLRLTRWLSLVRRRDPKTGRIRATSVLHDEPLTPFEAMQLDPDYLGLVSQALTHAAKAVQIVGMNTLKEIAEDPLLSGRTLPTACRCWRSTWRRHGWTTPGYPQEGADHESGPRKASSECKSPVFGIRSRPKTRAGWLSSDPKEDRTVRKDRIDEVRTVPRAGGAAEPAAARAFPALEGRAAGRAMIALQQVDGETSGRRCSTSGRRGAATRGAQPGRLSFGIIQKAIRGEFKAWAGESASAPPRPVTCAHRHRRIPNGPRPRVACLPGSAPSDPA